VLKLKKQKYAERTRLRSGPGKWWKANLHQTCPWRTARRDYNVFRTFTVPSAEVNFQFGAKELDLAIEYAKDKKIPLPPDPRTLTIEFTDDGGTPCSKLFPDCSYSELLLAVHGAERKHKHPIKLEPSDKAWLDLACKTLAKCSVDNPQKHFIGKPEGDNAFWSLLRISNGQLKAVLNGLSQAIDDFYAHPADRS
jgi:hypothetical protein